MSILVWFAFVAMVLVLVALDLGVLTRRSHAISIREALIRTSAWVSLALSFNVFVYFLYEKGWFGWESETSGRDAAIQFFTGYLLEQSLSTDNLFVIAVILSALGIPAASQHRVLFWGVVGAVVLRFTMIALGAVLIARLDWMVYVFGGFLILTAGRMLVVRPETIQPERTLPLRIARRLFPVAEDYRGTKFLVRRGGKLALTPLCLALVLVECSDVVFAVDSIPAIFAVTTDPFLVFTSNVFAILGLRSLYFALAGLMDRFRYLKASLVFVLAYVGVKMILAHHHPIPNTVSLAIIGGILAVGILASFAATTEKAPGAPRRPRRKQRGGRAGGIGQRS